MKMNLPGPSLLRVAVLVLSTGTLLTPLLHAQDAPPPPRQAGRVGPGGESPEQQQRQLDLMTRELSLTSDQVSQIKVIQAEGRTRMMTLRDDTSVAGPDKRTKMMAMRETEQTRIKAVLTDPQKIKFDAMMEKMKEQREHRQEGSAPPPPPSN